MPYTGDSVLVTAARDGQVGAAVHVALVYDMCSVCTCSSCDSLPAA